MAVGICFLLCDPRSWLEGSYELGSVRPSVRKFSWDWLISFFLKLGMVLEAHLVLCVTEPDFLKNIFFPKSGPEIGFFELIGKFSH